MLVRCKFVGDQWVFHGERWASLIAAGAAEEVGAQEQPAQASLLRCIFGSLPFRPVPLDPAWLAWQDGTIWKLAAAVYDDRAFDRLPVLADALEEAGCTDDDMLKHCRGPGPHARGCFVVDALLGKT
jgi:hypothetical protein